MKEAMLNRVRESIAMKSKIVEDPLLLDQVDKVTRACIDAIKSDHKIWFCGNGGSAADAQHLAAEFSGRFYEDREPYFAEALHVNTSYLTAVANDYSFDEIYARLIRAKARKGDVLIAMSTSGNSPNVVKAAKQAKKQHVLVVAMTGESGGQLFDIADLTLRMPSTNTPRIQEAHMLLGHIICEFVERELSNA